MAERQMSDVLSQFKGSKRTCTKTLQGDSGSVEFKAPRFTKVGAQFLFLNLATMGEATVHLMVEKISGDRAKLTTYVVPDTDKPVEEDSEVLQAGEQALIHFQKLTSDSERQLRVRYEGGNKFSAWIKYWEE